MMTTNKTHLTPEEVRVFQNKGVDFRSTADVWIQKSKDNWERRTRISQDKRIKEHTAHLGGTPQWVLPAPNLQETLATLPKKIIYKGRCYNVLLTYSDNDEWGLGYEEINYIEGYHYALRRLIYFLDSNPVVSAAKLLTWVLDEYPKRTDIPQG